MSKAEKRDAVDHGKEARLERAKDRTRGQFLCLLAQPDTGKAVYDIVATESEAIANDADARAWMEENDYRGVLYPVRFERGQESARRTLNREMQEVFKITQG